MINEQWKIFVGGVYHIAQRDCSIWIEAPHKIAKFMEMTNPDLVSLCLDTGRYQFEGGDPVAAVRQYADRIRHVHFKDCHPDIAPQARQLEQADAFAYADTAIIRSWDTNTWEEVTPL